MTCWQEANQGTLETQKPPYVKKIIPAFEPRAHVSQAVLTC